MIGFVVIKESGPTPRKIRKEHGRIVTELLAETASYHHKEHMHKHFTAAGGKEYGYAPRKGEGLSGKAFWQSYTGRKNKQKGHMTPLVWSGEQQELAKIRDVRAGRKKARLVQHARGLNRRNPKSNIRMNDEIRIISEREVNINSEFAGKLLRKKYRAISGTQITKI